MLKGTKWYPNFVIFFWKVQVWTSALQFWSLSFWSFCILAEIIWLVSQVVSLHYRIHFCESQVLWLQPASQLVQMHRERSCMFYITSMCLDFYLELEPEPPLTELDASSLWHTIVHDSGPWWGPFSNVQGGPSNFETCCKLWGFVCSSYAKSRLLFSLIK